AELEVCLVDAQEGAAVAARSTIAADLEKLVARGKLDAAKAAAMTGRLKPVASIADLGSATFVVEAIVEDLDVKRRLFADLEPRVRPQVLTQRMLEGGLLGRKRGAGFYRYVDGQQQRPPDPAAPDVAAPRVWIAGARDAAVVKAALAPGVQIETGAKPSTASL